MLAMCSTSSSHGQPDGVALAVGCYVHGVDHVADEEQPPAARALQPVQLLEQVGFLGLSGVVGVVGRLLWLLPGLLAGLLLGLLAGRLVCLAALVADGDDDVVAVLADLDLDRDLGLVAVA